MTQFIEGYVVDGTLGPRHDYDAARFKSIHLLAEMIEKQFKKHEAETSALRVRIAVMEEQLRNGETSLVADVELSSSHLAALDRMDPTKEDGAEDGAEDAAVMTDADDAGDGVQETESIPDETTNETKEYAPGPDGKHYEV
jgi:DNA-binding protein H-NS